MKRIVVALLALAGIAPGAPAASATDMSPQTDKYVTTTVFRDNGQLVYAVEVKNACKFTLQDVNQHAYTARWASTRPTRAATTSRPASHSALAGAGTISQQARRYKSTTRRRLYFLPEGQ